MTKCTIKLVKCTKAQAMAAKKAASKAAVSDFQFLDTQDDVLTVQGVDAAGNALDISALATISATSSDTSKISLDSPVGMSVKMHGLVPSVVGSPVTITVVATWNDGSIGPFTMTLPCDVTSGGPVGITITPGTPTIR